MQGPHGRWPQGAGPVLLAAGLALLVMWPLLAPGYVLTFDMVFVPRMPLSRELLGLSPLIPRAVPNDLIVAVASRAVPADLLQKVILAGALFGATIGAARLVPTTNVGARAAAGALYGWNAFVFERLVIGHWTVLVWFAALPFVVRAAVDARRGRPSARWRLAGALAVASFASAYGGVIATGTALLVLAAPPWREDENPLGKVAWTLGVAMVLNLPWLLPSLLHPGGLPVRTEGVAAFAARSDSPLGTVGSLLTLGGIWNGFVVPPGRSSLAWVPGFVVLLAISAGGWALTVRRRRDGSIRPGEEGRPDAWPPGEEGRPDAWPPGAAWGVLAGGAIGFLLAVSGSIPGLRDAVAFVVNHAPGGGILRDPQKFVAPLAIVEAVGFGLGVDRILGRAPSRRLRGAVVVVLAAAPIGLMPALAWGASSRLGTASYPPDWERARALMAADPVPGAVLVLPWHGYLRLPWNDGRPVLNPATRFFPRRAVINTDLELLSGTIEGEDPWTALADPVVRGDRALAAGLPEIGVRYLLLEKAGSWRSVLPRTTGLETILEGPSILLFRGTAPRRVEFPEPPAGPVIAGDVAAALLATWPIFMGMLAARRRLLVSFAHRRAGRADGATGN